MRIKKKFLQLTKKTYPRGTEHQLEKFLPEGWTKDSHGNYYLIVGSAPTCMFTCHLDTYGKEEKNIVHKFSKNFILTDGTTNLGADDKAGMVVLLYMIEKKVPGLYYFFLAEEVGCIGSKNVAEDIESGYYHIPELKKITKVISFDRKGTNSIITEQQFTECCSVEFASELANKLNSVGNGLNMKLDDTGYSTDSAQFMGVMSECTNISVGYYDEHTVSERQDIAYLYRLCQAVVDINWETLPAVRVPEHPWRKYYTASSYKSYGLDDWDAPWDSSIDSTYKPKSTEGTIVPSYKSVFEDRFSRNFYTYRVDPLDNIRKLAFVSKVWIAHETLLIKEGLKKQGIYTDKVDWDGTSCWVKEQGYSMTEYFGGRKDMSLYLDNFGDIPSHHLIFEDDWQSPLHRSHFAIKDF